MTKLWICEGYTEYWICLNNPEYASVVNVLDIPVYIHEYKVAVQVTEQR